jgi:hypothetical protein
MLNIALHKIRTVNPFLRPVKIPSINVNANNECGSNKSGDKTGSTTDVERELRFAQPSDQSLCHSGPTPVKYPLKRLWICDPIIEFAGNIISLYDTICLA